MKKFLGTLAPYTARLTAWSLALCLIAWPIQFWFLFDYADWNAEIPLWVGRLSLLPLQCCAVLAVLCCVAALLRRQLPGIFAVVALVFCLWGGYLCLTPPLFALNTNLGDTISSSTLPAGSLHQISDPASNGIYLIDYMQMGDSVFISSYGRELPALRQISQEQNFPLEITAIYNEGLSPWLRVSYRAKVEALGLVWGETTLLIVENGQIQWQQTGPTMTSELEAYFSAPKSAATQTSS